MKLFIHFAEVFIGDVGVYLCGANTAVSQHALDTTNVGAVHEKISRKAVTHGVWADMFGDAGNTGVF